MESTLIDKYLAAYTPNYFTESNIAEDLKGDISSFPLLLSVEDLKIDIFSFSLPLSVKVGNVGRRPSGLSEEAKNSLQFISATSMKLVDKGKSLKDTKILVFPKRSILNGETEEFIEKYQLRNGINWLQTAIKDFFPDADYEIEILASEDGEENMLALRVYGSLSASEFREQRHAICKAMISAGHKNIFEVISIFQRRMRNDGRKAISCYSLLVAA